MPYASLGNPQTLNLYAYVGNNPVTTADADGHMIGPIWAGFDRHRETVVKASSSLFSVETLPGGDVGPAVPSSGTLTSARADANAAANALADPDPPQQAQDASAWKKQVELAIEFQKYARALYQKFGPTAKTVDELENGVTKALEKKYGKIEVAGTTSSSGKVKIKHDPNPYTREATKRHERVHEQTTLRGMAEYGKGTPAFHKWYSNPQNWAADEVKAYSAGIRYLEQVLRQMNTPK